ncbi:M28 family peptidase [candidate division KSB1 bacterium]
MKSYRLNILLLSVFVIILISVPVIAQKKGLNTITAGELKTHISFMAADDFLGRYTPSVELEICSEYLATLSESYGLKPLMPDGSWFQELPLNVTKASESRTQLRVFSENGEQIFYFPQAFGGSFRSPGTYGGDVVFAGYGASAQDLGWDDVGELNVTGKVVILIDGQLPDGHALNTQQYRLSSRISAFNRQGAAAVLTVISEDNERRMADNSENFINTPRARLNASYESQQTARRSRQTAQPTQRQPAVQQPPVPPRPPRPSLPFGQAEIRHEVAAAILGISKDQLSGMFSMINRGQQVSAKEISGKRVEMSVNVDRYPASARNVLAVLEGSDDNLKDEYVVICAHHDHLGIRNGSIIAGADDNASGTAALLEIAQAMLLEKPKRSIIFAWLTGEEMGLWGSHYFVNNCPVPVENISAALNLDMIARNDPDSLFLVASDLLSSELDGAIHKVNDKNTKLGFSYIYSNRTHSQRVYYRSDQYPHIRFGIPSVWLFGGFTPDYHTPLDIVERCDFNKVEKVTKLTYLTALEIANKKELLKLDVNPEVTSRGRHNLIVETIKKP